MRSRSRMMPAIGAYWFNPALMYFVTRSRNSFAQSKSGKPCDRLIALCSCASFDITVKIVVPTAGSLDAMGRGNEGMAPYSNNTAGRAHDSRIILFNTPLRGTTHDPRLTTHESRLTNHDSLRFIYTSPGGIGEEFMATIRTILILA